MHKQYFITYSCPRHVWCRRTLVDNMLEDLLYGMTFRITASRQHVVHLTDKSFRRQIDLLSEKQSRVLFRVRVPAKQFPNGMISSVVTQLWGNIIDYPGIRLESIDPRLIVAYARRTPRARKQEYLRLGRGPLLGIVFKPTWGLSTEQKVDLACRFIEMGGDLVKEDETYFQNADDIVKEQSIIQTALNTVSSSSRGSGINIPNITGIAHSQDAIDSLVRSGMTIAMVNFLVCGMGFVQELAARTSPKLALWGHRVGYACMARTMSVYALIQLAIASGLGFIHVGTPTIASQEAMGKTAQVIRMLSEMAAHGGPSVWPVFTKTTVSTVPTLISRFGADVVLLACGELRAGAQRGISESRTKRWIDAARG